MARRAGSPRVSVVKKSRYRFLMLRYRPADGPEQLRSSGTTVRREAERAAARWEAELADSLAHASRPGSTSWAEFVDRYERQSLWGLADASALRADLVLRRFAREMAPQTVGDVTSAVVSTFASGLRGAGLAEATIESYLLQLHAALSWAWQTDLIPALPKFPRIKRSRGGGGQKKAMRGRALTSEEFGRMLAAVPQVLTQDVAPAWERLLRGLWLSGLRLEESINLWWDRPDRLSVDLTGRRPFLLIPAAEEKGNQDRIWPVTPDFAEFLLATPPGERQGLVFFLPRQKAAGEVPSKHWVSRTITEIGRAAGVVVDARTGKPASAHDLRRSFGARWAPLVMPQVLMELMRHSSIVTTMRFYVGRQALATADTVWSAWESRVVPAVSPDSEPSQLSQLSPDCVAHASPSPAEKGDNSGDNALPP